MDELDPVEAPPPGAGRPGVRPPVAGPTGAAGRPGDAAAPVILEDFDTDDRDAVLSAARRRTTVQRAPGIVTVITADEIARRGHRTVNDVLRTVPGFEGGRYESNGWFNESTARGQPRTLLILINGVNVTEPIRNSFSLDRKIPIRAVKRVEVTSGPGGVLWGSNALLGVVNIILKDQADLDGLETVVGGGGGPGAQDAALGHLAYGGAWLGGKIRLYTALDLYSDRGAVLEVDAVKVLGVLPAPEADGKTLYENRRLSTDNNSRDYWVSSIGRLTIADELSLDWLIQLEQDHRQIATGGAILEGTRARADGSVGPTRVETLGDDSVQTLSLAWRHRFGERFGLSAKGYGVRWTVNEDPFWAFPPRALAGTDALAEGIGLALEVPSLYRFGVNLDFDLELPAGHHLVFGGEFYQDRMRNAVRRDTLRGRARIPDLAEAGADDPAVAEGVFGPGRCPPAGRQVADIDGRAVPATFGENCRFEETLLFDTTRTVTALYLADQWSLGERLTLQPGVRLQYSGDYGLVPLFAGALIWNVVDKVYLKLNYAEGFRPPEFQAGRINPYGLSSVSYQSDPDIGVERSRAGEVEVNAILLEGQGPLRQLFLRADYGYSVLSDLVRNVGGRFGNSGQRDIHSVEFLVRADFAGDHGLWIGGHHMRAEDSVFGPVRNFPNWVFTSGGHLSLLSGHLELSALATLIGPQEDANRAADTGAQLAGFDAADATDIEVDRVDAYVLLRLGVRVQKLWHDRLWISAFVYNAASPARTDPDFFFDDRVTSRPQPREGWSALGQLGVRWF
jgi:outer membrane receptor protein involved in Fe transport